VIVFIDHTRLETTRNYSTTANPHNSQITRASVKPFLAYCVFTSLFLATISNSGDSLASRAQVLSSQPSVGNCLTTQSGCCACRRTGKAVGQGYQCWRICREINVFYRFEYHMFYVLYPFVAYLLTLPRIRDTPHTAEPAPWQVSLNKCRSEKRLLYDQNQKYFSYISTRKTIGFYVRM
jgi:hypothetical protein